MFAPLAVEARTVVPVAMDQQIRGLQPQQKVNRLLLPLRRNDPMLGNRSQRLFDAGPAIQTLEQKISGFGEMVVAAGCAVLQQKPVALPISDSVPPGMGAQARLQRLDLAPYREWLLLTHGSQAQRR